MSLLLASEAAHGAAEAGAEAAHGVGEAVAAGLPHIAYSPLPALLILVPLVGAALVYPLGRRSERARDMAVVAVSALTLLGSVALLPLVREAERIGCEVPLLVGRLTFTIDSFAMLFALFTSLVWFAATLYSVDYLVHEHKRDRYHTANLAVLAATLGVVLAGDLVTLYLAFEALGIVAYLLVVHTETSEAKQASIKYLWMTVLGGFALVAGIFLAYAAGATGVIAPLAAKHGGELLRWSAALLMIAGFGVKAGMVPLHIWLPDAHPVAPSPASALLSGVMIKAGAYGIFRVVEALFRPAVVEHAAGKLWNFTSGLGLVVLWIGVATMFIGVVLALLQENAKRMLAYHSVSQMGFILLGLGAAAYLGTEAQVGIAGGLYHVLNHALFKAALFLGVGAVFFRTGELNMYKLGGLWRRMPFTFTFMLIAAFGITGVPLFNGFVSKCLIHHALVEAAELHHAASLKAAEIIFIVTCGGTACSFIKLIGFVFLGRPKEERPEVRDAPWRMLVAMGLLAAFIVTFGVAPGLVLRTVFIPGLHTWRLEANLLEAFTPFTVDGFVSVAWALGIGATVFVVGVRFGLFHAHFPKWFSLDYWYRQLAQGSARALRAAGAYHDAVLAETSGALKRGRRVCAVWASRLRRRWARVVVTIATGAPVVRNEHFVETAYVALMQERHDTVREAVAGALERLRDRKDLDDALRQRIVESVRAIASYMSRRLFRERMAVLGELVQQHAAEVVATGLRKVLPGLACYRQAVADTAYELAEPRMRGVNVTREISAAMNVLMGQERFDLLMKKSLPAPARVSEPALSLVASYGGSGLARLEQTPSEGLTRLEKASRWISDSGRVRLQLARAEGLSRLERYSRWVTDMGRIAVDVMRQENVPWLLDDRIDRESVVATRRAIQRYVRDLSLNLGIALVVFLALLAALGSNL